MSKLPTLPVEPADVTPEWLSEALRERFPSASVASVEILEIHDGTNSNARLRVAYDNASSEVDGPCELPGV